MINKIISLRYARALEKVCQTQALELETAYAQLENVCLVLKQNPQLFELLKVSIYPLQNKLNFIEAISTFVVRDFLELMINNNRIEFIFDTLDSFKNIMMLKQNKAKGLTISATELDQNQKEALHRIFSKITGKGLEFEFITDKSLIGGIKVEVDGKTYDGSIKTYLANIANRLNNLNISQGGNG